MIAGARVEVAPYKRDPMDFVLWKPSDADTPGWDSPWGRGRPGWHIECSAMAHDLLGDTFDIHGGGNDLMFPHHENEIAQSKCAGHDFAKIWMHNEMLQVEGKKMSKSLGNFFTVHDLLEQGVPGEVIRFVFLSTHYRKPMDWTEKKAAEAEKTLRKWFTQLEGVASGRMPDGVIAALADNMNTPGALAELHRLNGAGDWGALRAGLEVLGLIGDSVPAWVGDDADTPSDEFIEKVDHWIAERASAKMNKDYKRADTIRDHLLRLGIGITDSKEGTSWVSVPALGDGSGWEIFEDEL
jgi:cysteinyl-tRNA synthetase